MKAITADARMPAYCTVFRWMQVVPDFGRAVATVRWMLAVTRQSEADAWRLVRKDQRRERQGRRARGPSTTGSCSTAALAAVLARVRDGASVRDAVAHPGAPSVRTLYSRVRNCPGFRAAFVDACDWRGAWLAFQAELVIDEVGDYAAEHPRRECQDRGAEGAARAADAEALPHDAEPVRVLIS